MRFARSCPSSPRKHPSWLRNKRKGTDHPWPDDAKPVETMRLSGKGIVPVAPGEGLSPDSPLYTTRMNMQVCSSSPCEIRCACRIPCGRGKSPSAYLVDSGTPNRLWFEV